MPSDQVPQVTLKTEMNSSYKRLPTFRAPRDLKLSQFRDIPSSNALAEGKPKKVFVPNLNVHRKKNDEDSRAKDADVGDNSKKDTRLRGTDTRGRGTDSRGRGRKPREYIQQTGVFSQGLAPSLKSAPWGSKSVDSSSSSAPPKPRLKLNEDLKVNKEEEEEVMKQLLRDDFIDDPEIQADMDNAPVELPLQDCCKLERIKDEKPFVTPNANSPKCSYSESSLINGIKVKPDPELLELSNGIAEGIDRKPFDAQAMRSLALTQLLSSSAETNFLFFQIPHRVPKLKMNVNPLLGGQKRSAEKSNDEEEGEACVIRSLPQGRIGTMQIRKSGRAALVLGDVRLNVEPGTQSAFKQNLVSVNLENSTKSGNMIDMGRIATRILVTPDWKHLLTQSK